MIQANELRIGNILKSGKGLYRIYALSHPMILAIQSIKYTIDSEKGVYAFDSTILEPIPLSEEILFKVGFSVMTLDRNKWCQIEIGYLKFIFYGGIIQVGVQGVGQWQWIQTKFVYLHQLQNLYFALTGSDLDLSKLI